MTLKRALCGLAAALCITTSGAALAEPSKLVIVVGGEAYDGVPRFAVTFDGHELGQRAVEDAIDTVGVGRFAEAADRSVHVQNFEFEIPEDVFKATGPVRVKFLNEAYGGEGSNHDRNLFLASVSVNGRTVTASGLKTATAEGVEPGERMDEFLILHDGTEDGLSVPPKGGWPAPAVVEAASIALPRLVAPEKAEPALQPARPVADAPSVAVPLPVEPVELKLVEIAPTPHPPVAARNPVKANEAIETANISAGETAASCTLERVYNVVGFNENSNDLTTRLEQRLDQILADIGDQKCIVQVTGYSSTQGAYATNALFAVERAQNVLRYLREKGLSFEKVSATGAGETTQFGPHFRANRRVVISVSP